MVLGHVRPPAQKWPHGPWHPALSPFRGLLWLPGTSPASALGFGIFWRHQSCRGEHKTFLEAECSQNHVESGRTAGFLCTCAPFSTMAFSPQPKTMVEALVDPRYCLTCHHHHFASLRSKSHHAPHQALCKEVTQFRSSSPQSTMRLASF